MYKQKVDVTLVHVVVFYVDFLLQYKETKKRVYPLIHVENVKKKTCIQDITGRSWNKL